MLVTDERHPRSMLSQPCCKCMQPTLEAPSTYCCPPPSTFTVTAGLGAARCARSCAGAGVGVGSPLPGAGTVSMPSSHCKKAGRGYQVSQCDSLCQKTRAPEPAQHHTARALALLSSRCWPQPRRTCMASQSAPPWSAAPEPLEPGALVGLLNTEQSPAEGVREGQAFWH